MGKCINDDSKRPSAKALVIVRGGVAEVLADTSVDALVVDYDNDPDGTIPATHRHLLET